MSNKFNEQWSIREKTELLVNILQGHTQDPTPFLVQAILDSGYRPQWDLVCLPSGRSLQVCRQQFDALVQQQQYGRPNQFPNVAQTTPPFTSTAPPSRMFGEQQTFQAQVQPLPRAIQPRPSHSTESPNPASTNGDTLTIVRTSGADINADRRKKRGRPTKEEAEERDRQYAAEGKVYEPKKRPSKKFRSSTGTSIPVSDGGPLTGSSGSPPLSTPLPQMSEVQESSSSGKRRARRQPGLTVKTTATESVDPADESPSLPPTGDPQGDSSGGGVSGSVLHSPSDRVFLGRYGARLAEPSQRDRSVSEQFPPSSSSRDLTSATTSMTTTFFKREPHDRDRDPHPPS